jgi:hypothetical protein
MVERKTARKPDHAAAGGHKQPRAELAPGVWRATVDQRLTGLEDAIDDLRTRVNSVLGLIAAAVIGQVLLRLLGH